jgi:hypothetical protein
MDWLNTPEWVWAGRLEEQEMGGAPGVLGVQREA